MRRRKERTLADVRILGSGGFVERMIQEADDRFRGQRVGERRLGEASQGILRVREREQIRAKELRLGSRRRRLTAVRARLAMELVIQLGLPLAEAAVRLGVSAAGISKAITRALEK